VSERLRMQVAGMTWTVRVAGQGHPVLFLHGFSGSGLSWAGIVGLGSRVRAIVPDLPGHGGTAWEGGREPDAGAGAAGSVATAEDAPPDRRPRASVERTADDLATIVRRLGAERVDVVGYSMGARIALRLAVAHPEAVGRLVLEDPRPAVRSLPLVRPDLDRLGRGLGTREGHGHRHGRIGGEDRRPDDGALDRPERHVPGDRRRRPEGRVGDDPHEACRGVLGGRGRAGARGDLGRGR